MCGGGSNNGGGGKDWLFGQKGADKFVLSANDKGTTSSFTIIKDYVDGEDKFAFDSTMSLSKLAVSSFKTHTVFWIRGTTDVLALVENVSVNVFDSQDFTTLEIL